MIRDWFSRKDADSTPASSVPAALSLGTEPMTEGELRQRSAEAGNLKRSPAFRIACRTLRERLLADLESTDPADQRTIQILQLALWILPNLIDKLDELANAAAELDATQVAEEERRRVQRSQSERTPDFGFSSDEL